MEKIWLKQYPAGVPAEIDVNQYSSLVALLDEVGQPTDARGHHRQREEASPRSTTSRPSPTIRNEQQ